LFIALQEKNGWWFTISLLPHPCGERGNNKWQSLCQYPQKNGDKGEKGGQGKYFC